MSEDKEILSVLISEIEKFAKEEVERILNEAKLQAEKIIVKAEFKAKQLRKERIDQLRKKAKLKLRRDFSLKKLELRQKYIFEKERYLDQLFNNAMNEIMKCVKRQNSIYKEGLKNLIIEALSNISKDEVIILCNERDKELVESLLNQVLDHFRKHSQREIKVLRVIPELDCLGGVVVHSSDEKEYYNNTIEARIRLLKSEILPYILRRLGCE